MEHVQVTVLCDQCGKTAEKKNLGFAWGSSEYVIDLCDKCYSTLEKAVSPYVGVARKVKKAGAARGSKPASNDNQQIRVWATAQGLEVPSRGRIPASIREAFDQAHA